MPESATVFGTYLRVVLEKGTWRWQMLCVLEDKSKEGNRPPKWGEPAGGVEEGETPLRAIIREFEEETGLLFADEQVKEIFRESSQDHERIYFVLTGKPRGGKLRRGSEILEVEWQYVDELTMLPEGFYPRQLPGIQRVISTIKTNEALSKLVKKNAQSRP